MRHPKQLILGVCGSVVLLVVFFIMQSRNGPLVEIPKYLLLFSLAPVAIGLVAGGYVTRFKTKWIELESLPEAPQTQASAPLKAGTGDWRLQHSEEYGRTHHYMLAHVYRPSTEPARPLISSSSSFVTRRVPTDRRRRNSPRSRYRRLIFVFGG